eukprot:330112_1
MGICCAHPNLVALDPDAEHDFTELDTEGDGFISNEKMISRMKRNEFDDEIIDHFMKILDQDGDGKITLHEFNDSFAYWKLLRVYNRLLKEQDNQSGEVSTEAFKKALADDRVVLNVGRKESTMITNTADNLMKMFIDKLDANHDGKVSAEEIRNAYEIAKSWKMFNEIDQNKNGVIEGPECIQYFKKRHYGPTAIQLAFVDTDVDYSGFLTFNEFHARFVKALFKRQRQVAEVMMHTRR